jgi:hypothetical protein
MTTLDEIRTRALASLIPAPKLALLTWIEGELRLPEGVSALPGPVRLWPYQVGIADAISDPAIERVTLVKPVRVGFTTLSLAMKLPIAPVTSPRRSFACCRRRATPATTLSAILSRYLPLRPSYGGRRHPMAA